jgi:hypothetical protein
MPLDHTIPQKAPTPDSFSVSQDSESGERVTGYTPKQSAILRMQATQGNAAVRRKLEGGSPIQRDAAPAPATAPAADPFILNGVTINTKGDLSGFYETHKQLLVDAGEELTKDKLSYPATMLLGPIAAQRNIDALSSKSADPVDAKDHAAADAWFATFESALVDAEKTKAAAASAALAQAIGGFQAASNRITGVVIPQLQDVQRTTFAKEDSNAVLKVADGIATAVDTSLVLKDGVVGLQKVAIELQANELKWLGKGTPPTMKWLPNVLKIADQVNKAYAGFQLVRAAISVIGGASTSAEEGRNAVSAMSTIISAGGTLLGASTGMTLYANLYIGPMVDACLSQLANIENMIKNQNLKMMKEGLWHAVVWGVEQGGKATFDFMVQVMRAGSPAQVPNPVPPEVSKLFMTKEDALNAGVLKGNPMPTSGSWFWKKPDPNKIGEWVFKSRSQIWGMLYGSAPVP